MGWQKFTVKKSEKAAWCVVFNSPSLVINSPLTHCLPHFSLATSFPKIANPGCYPTTIQLPLIPLLQVLYLHFENMAVVYLKKITNSSELFISQAKLIETSDIIIDAKSGVSGAGLWTATLVFFSHCLIQYLSSLPLFYQFRSRCKRGKPLYGDCWRNSQLWNN